MKRRDFIKGLVAVPVVAKIGVDAAAKPKGVVFASVLEENPTIELAPDTLIVPRSLEADAIAIFNGDSFDGHTWRNKGRGGKGWDFV